MTGTPKIEVIAFIGRVILRPGNCEIISLKSIVTEPIKIVAGRSIICDDVLNIILERCGTATPIKAIGPQKAVTLPAIMLVLTKIKALTT